MTDPDELTADEQILLAQVDAILEQGDRAGPERNSLLGLCVHLATTVPLARREYKQRLWVSLAAKRAETLRNQSDSFEGIQGGHFPAWSRRRLPSPGAPGRLAFYRRKPAVMIVVVILIILAAACIPSVRAFAGHVISQIVLGKYSGASQVEPQSGEGNQVAAPAVNTWSIDTGLGLDGGALPPGVDPAPRSFLTVGEAQAQVSYPVLQPERLPEGYTLRQVKLAPKGAGEHVYLFYAGPGKDIVVISNPVGEQAASTPGLGTTSPGGLVTVRQLVTESQLVTTGSLEEANVNGRPAAWADGKLLAWEADGIFYQVGGLDLTLNQAVEIAESIR